MTRISMPLKPYQVDNLHKAFALLLKNNPDYKGEQIIGSLDVRQFNNGNTYLTILGNNGEFVMECVSEGD